MLKKIVSFVRGKLKGLDRTGGKHGERASHLGVSTVPASVKEAVPESKVQAVAPLQSPAVPKYRRPKVSKASDKVAWDLSKFEVVPVEGKSRFHDFDLPDTIMHAIADLGFQYCTPIQAKTLVATMSGTDAIGQAQTGTGKTAAFLIAVMSQLLRKQVPDGQKIGRPRALVIAPTRELVMQIAKDGESLASYCGIKMASVFGGMDYEKQQLALERGPVDIVVATPGRLIDFQRKGVLDLGKVEVMVIDEADRMLDMGFIPDVRRIVSSTPPREKRQTLMFSATMTSDVRRLASQWCVNPINVEIAPEQVAVDTVQQIVYLTTASEKYDVLYNMLVNQNLDKVLVFTNRRDETQRLTDRLLRNSISCDMLSGDVAQKKRMTTLERFRNGQIKVLVATDVAGRGIHIDGISHVFNYTLPYEAEDYVHRIGRTGRAGHDGVAISFADEDGAFYLPAIEAYIGRKLTCVQPDEALIVPAPRGISLPSSAAPSSAKPSSRRPPTSSRSRSSTSRPGPHRPNVKA
jgi:ATP-dependent RNA helicase RhlB